MHKQSNMRRFSGMGLLPLLMVAACTQPSFLASNSPTDNSTVDHTHESIANISAHDFKPPRDPVIADEFPNTERISMLPAKVGECADTTITSITDRFGADLAPGASKKGADKGTIVRFSNSGVQVSLAKERAVVRSQIFDKVNMCLVEIPRDCPAGDERGRLYKTTNLRTGENWSLRNDIRSCGGA
jgi:hypothetical protein